MTTARKIAWALIHTELRRRLNDDPADRPFEVSELEWFGRLLKEAREAKVDEVDIIIDMAGFAATYAQMPRTDNEPLAVAAKIAALVMSEPDCPVTGKEHSLMTDDDGEDPNREFCAECGWNDPIHDDEEKP